MQRVNKSDPKAAAAVPASKLSERRCNLWNAINRYVHEQGASVVSIPYWSPVRIEVGRGSDLPAKLIEFGYHPHHAGAVTRVTARGFVPADIIEIDLPK